MHIFLKVKCHNINKNDTYHRDTCHILRYIKISIASNVAIKYKGDTPIKYYGDV